MCVVASIASLHNRVKRFTCTNTSPPFIAQNPHFVFRKVCKNLKCTLLHSLLCIGAGSRTNLQTLKLCRCISRLAAFSQTSFTKSFSRIPVTVFRILNEQLLSLRRYIYFLALARRAYLKLLQAHFFKDFRHSFTCLPDVRMKYCAAYREGCVIHAVLTRYCALFISSKVLSCSKSLVIYLLLLVVGVLQRTELRTLRKAHVAKRSRPLIGPPSPLVLGILDWPIICHQEVEL